MTSRSDLYELPIETYPLHWWCQCGERYLWKIRMTAPVPFPVHCFCGKETLIDPTRFILLPED